MRAGQTIINDIEFKCGTGHQYPVLPSLIISTNYSIHFKYLSNAIKSNGGCPPSNIITSPPYGHS
jgi:hypothetical protein